MKTHAVGVLMAIGVVIVWGTTFISTKLLLVSLSPVEIMFDRYLLGYLTLWVLYPRRHGVHSWREELKYACAGFFGGTLYFTTENYALQLTQASSVGLLVSTSPMLTLIAARFMVGERVTRGLFIGCVVAFSGVTLVTLDGHFSLSLNPLGDMLAVAAAGSWAIYAVLVKQMQGGYNGLYITRKIFFYSLVTMLPLLPLTGYRLDPVVLVSGPVAGHLLFLGVLASAICFVLWSKVIWMLGPVRANNFIYAVPLVTTITSMIVLGEHMTLTTLCGGVLILGGVYVSTAGGWLLQHMPGRTKSTQSL